MQFHAYYALPRLVHLCVHFCHTHRDTRLMCLMHRTRKPHVRIDIHLDLARKIKTAARTAIPHACHIAAIYWKAPDFIPAPATYPAKTAIPLARHRHANHAGTAITGDRRGNMSGNKIDKIGKNFGNPTCQASTGGGFESLAR